MKWFAGVVGGVALALLVYWGLETRKPPLPPYHESMLTLDLFGEARIFRPDKVTKVVFLFANKSFQTSSAFKDEVRPLFAANALIIAIDPEKYLTEAGNGEDGCVVIGGEIERLSQSLQSALKLDQFHKPLLVGIGEKGALVAYITRFQSPDRFLATIAYDLCPRIPQGALLCDTPQLETKRYEQGDFFTVKEPAELSATLTSHFEVSFDAAPECALPARAASFPSEHTIPSTVTLTEVLEKLVSHALPSLSEHEGVLVEMPADNPSYLALFISGDGGWAGIDQETGEYLRSRGVSVLGFNALKYFWKLKTPEETSKTIAHVFSKYETKWQVSKFVLIGYSLGAGVAPVIYNKLPIDIQAKIHKIVMIGPESKVDLEVHISDWLGLGDETRGIPLKPEAERIPPEKLVCIFGQDDTAGLCSELDKSRSTVVPLPGGHHFDGDYSTVGAAVLGSF